MEAVGTWLTPEERQALDRLGPLDFIRWAQLGWERSDHLPTVEAP
jgi:hypothetical protein